MTRWITACVWIGFGFALHAAAQEPIRDSPAMTQPATQKIEAERLAKMVLTRTIDDGPAKQVPLHDHALLRFDDPTRANEFGSIWIWADGGRPAAILESYWSTNRLWVMVVNQLDEGSIQVTMQDRSWWTPQQTDVVWVPLPSQDNAATGPVKQSLQLRSIARRFRSHEFWDPGNSRYELRLLSRPLYRYTDPSRNVQDGALFVFANGTNPEVILLLEARTDHDNKPLKWYMGFARLGHAEMHVLLDDQSVWTVSRVQPRSPNENYWLSVVAEP